MNKLFLSSFVVISFVAYGLSQHFHLGDDDNAPVKLQAAAPVSSSSPSPTVSVQPKYKNGTYTGKSADAYYGNIQVRATVSGGNLSDVQFLDYPQDRRHSLEISQQAMPLLKSEAISAQSSQVDIISGATMTSQAFIESLGSALSQAS